MSAVLVCATAAGAPAWAQAGDGVQQVTVTARKRAELQLEVPISMQTLTDKDLRASGTLSVQDLGTQTGFVFTAAQSTGAYGRAAGMLTFRGLQGDLGRPNESSGGIFIDGVAITGGISTLGMSDVSRAEVLKGPQNAFFGRSTFGGAVNFITRNPSDKLRGTVNLTLDQLGGNNADASIEGSLVTGLMTGRVSVASHKRRAQFTASDGGELGAESSRSVSATLYVTPMAGLWLRARGSFQINDDSLPAVAYIPATGNTSCTGQTFTGVGRDGATVSYTPGTPYFCGSIPSLKTLGKGVIDANTAIPASARNAFIENSLGDPFLAKSPKINHTGMRSEVKHVALQAGKSLPAGMDLAVNVGYNQANTTSIFDLDKTKTLNFMNVQVTPTNDLTVDARLASDPEAALRWLVGASRYTATYQFGQIDLNAGLGATAPVIGANYSNFDSTVPAVYGSVEYDITKQITATFETRFQKDKVVSYTRAGVALQNETSNSLPRATLRWRPNAETSLYVNVAKGVQPLTVNSGYTAASEAGKALIRAQVPGASDFTPQPRLTAFEIGAKQRLGANFQYALAIYNQKWLNRLTSTSLFNPVSCGTTTGTTECPFTAAGAGVQGGNDARIRGLELSLDAMITPQLSAGAYIDIKQAKWIRYDSSSQSRYGSNRALALTGDAVSFPGNKVGRVPDVTVSANATWRWAMKEGWQGFLRGDLTHVGRQWESDFNFARTDAYQRVDLRLGFEKGEGAIELFVKNVADDRSWISAARVPNLGLTPLVSFSQQGLTAVAQDARTLGVRMRHVF